MIDRCEQAGNIEIASMALAVLNNELPKPPEERNDSAVEACLSNLATLSPEYKLNKDRTKIEYCRFGCDACHATVSVEDSTPIVVVSLPDACPERPNDGVISIAGL